MLAIGTQNIPVEVTFEPGLLFVAMKVFDTTDGYPGTFISTIPMIEYDNSNYGASFMGTATRNYSVSKSVYTDGTYTTRDTNYSSGSETFQVVIFPNQDQILAFLRAALVPQNLQGKIETVTIESSVGTDNIKSTIVDVTTLEL